MLSHRPTAATAIAFLAFGLVYMTVNAVSLIDERSALGRPIAASRAWLLEGTSYLAWLILLPLILLAAVRLARCRPWVALAGHVSACLLVSVFHTAVMSLLRLAAFTVAGLEYATGEALADRLVFELRKDIITYASIVAVFLVLSRLKDAAEAARKRRVRDQRLIEVRDGSRTILLRPDEIDWVGAAGNYVELHGPERTELSRKTMIEMSAELQPHGFVRIHRSRLVRRGAIASVTTRQSGDFDIQLISGEYISGSRRFRHNLR